MRIYVATAFLLSVLLCAGSVEAEIKFEILKSAKTIKGITFPEGTRIEYTPAGKINYAILEQPENIQDVPCEGWLYFYESGKLKSAQLARNYEAYGFSFAKGSKLYFFESGKIRRGTIAADKSIGRTTFKPGTTLSLYQSGKIDNVSLASEQEIQGILCDAGKVQFYDSGRIKSAKIAVEKEFGHVKIPKGSFIELYPSGKIKSAALSESVVIDGKTHRKGGLVLFLEDGEVLLTR